MTRNTDAPLVSVIIPVFNAGWCVERAIQSVLDQTFRSFELIIVNDGSTDDTHTKLAHYGDTVRVVSQANSGMSSARNTGIRVARGQYVAFLDADDVWFERKLELQVNCMEGRPELAFCAATAQLVSPEGQPLGLWACGKQLDEPQVATVFANHAAVAGGASSVLARRELVVELGGFDCSLAGAEDTDLWLRLAAAGRFECLDAPMVTVLKRPGSVSCNREAMRCGTLRMTLKNRHLLPPALRGAFWRRIYAGALCDYAKWAYRDGHLGRAVLDALRALINSPIGRGRLAVSLLFAMLRGKSV